MKLPIILAMAAVIGANPVFADRPDHAPAHGHHKKHHDHDRDDDDREYKKEKKYKKNKHYKGKTGAVYVEDYGISAGRCNRDEIGAVIGGVAGAVIGRQVVDREDRVVGMVVGGVLGAVLGHTIGDRMDDRDRACMGHALELGRPGVPVEWKHDGRHYHFTPQGDVSGGCRNAVMTVDGRDRHNVLACPTGKGEWRFRRS